MSKYSGKCDVCDHFDGQTDEEISQYKIYLPNQIVPLRIDSRRDLIPYYPHLVVIGAFGDGSGTLRISQNSYVDDRERDIIRRMVADVERIQRRHKRNKTPFVPDDVPGEINSYSDVPDVIIEIARRVDKDGSNAKYDDIRIPYLNHYRDDLMEEMIANGYDKDETKYYIWRDLKDIKGALI